MSVSAAGRLLGAARIAGGRLGIKGKGMMGACSRGLCSSFGRRAAIGVAGRTSFAVDRGFSTGVRRRNPDENTSTSTQSPSTPSSPSALIPPTHLDPSELHIFETIASSNLSPQKLTVKDVSGGCGSMYAIEVCSEAFRGLGVLKQQRAVVGVLGKELIGGWHGLQVKTSVP